MIRNLLKNNPYIWLQIEDLYPYLEKFLSETEIKTAKLIQTAGFGGEYIYIQYIQDNNHYQKNYSIPIQDLKEIMRDKKIDELLK